MTLKQRLTIALAAIVALIWIGVLTMAFGG